MALMILSICATAISASASPIPQSAPSKSEAKVAEELLRNLHSRVSPSLVRIETVGGSQPVEIVEAESSDDAPGAPPRKPRQETFRDTPGSSFRVADGPTTGIVYSADGYIVTSSFNFVREPELISVVLSDGRRLAADLIARDQVHKVALLKTNAKDLPVPTWALPADLRVGEGVMALGLGLGSRTPAVSVGIVSALRRMSGNCVQTDAKLSPANYGGPLATLDGRVIGLCVPMAQRPGELAGIEMYDSGVGFALTKDRVDAIVAGLKTGQSVYRGWLGIAVDPHRDDAVILDNLADPSPMRSAGARKGDRIVEVDGAPILHYGQFFQKFSLLPAGRSVRMKLLRGEEALNIEVTLARATELGALPEIVEEPFDPSDPKGDAPPPHVP
ncbi:MAG: trypsin-like peptidase domain-containing protein [Phycisphaerales bacterium]|nr:trypsin-like peptidase domain-containing protein [Phycisphaerales bacterium]